MEITEGQVLADGVVVLEVCATTDGLGEIVCVGIKGLSAGVLRGEEDWGTTWYTMGEVRDRFMGG